MKKNTIRVFFFFFLAIGLFFYNTNLTKAADPLAKITSITPDPVDTTKVVITGTINAEGGTILYDNLYNPVVLYGPAGDSGKPDIKSLKSVSCFRSNPTPGPTFCQFDRNSDNSGVFTATISGLVEGGDYVAIPYSADNNSNRYPIGESEGEPFSIKGIAHPIVTFGSTTPVGKNGQEITVNIKNLSAPATGYIELGTATQIEKTAKYTCTTNGKVSDKKTVSATTGDSSKSITVIFNDLEDGVYCIRPMVVALPYDLAVAEGHERDRAGFWTAKGALFGIGVKIDPNATNDPGANALGCKYEKDNKSYCLLAPLPGVGDTTGKLDVTKGIGNYFNMIIKLVMGIIGVLAVLMVVVGGIEYMSTVNLGEKEGARARITSAILGLLLALSAYLILKTINPDLVNVNIGVPEGTITVDESYTPTSGGGQYTGGGGSTNVTKNITSFDTFLKTSSSKYGVECTLIKSLMYAESGGNIKATSGVGAKGLVQLMPSTFTNLGYNMSDIYDPAINIDAAAKYVSKLKSTACNGSSSNSVCNTNNIQYVIASYNGGPKANGYSNICKKGQSIDTTAWQCTINSGYAETRNYVSKVLGNHKKLTDNAWGC